MKKLIIYFLLILGSIWLGSKIYQNPGYILVFYKQWAIETTIWFLVLVLIFLLLLFHLLLNLLRNTMYLPKYIEHWWHKHQVKKSIKLLNRGYCDYLRGRWKKAEKYLVKSAKNKDFSFIGHTLSAKAANAQHALSRRNRYLFEAKKSVKKQGYLADAMMVQFLLQQNLPEEALTLLIQLRRERPKEPILLRLLAECYLHIQDWTHLQNILPELKKNKVFDEEEYLAIEKSTYTHLLTDHYFTEFSQVQMLWNKIPRYLRHDSHILIAYANHLTRWNRGNAAEELIRKELKKDFTQPLMEYYVTTRSEHPSKQIALGEKYLKQNTEDARSLRAMGILCLRNRLWGQARDYLENSLRMQATPETYSALGYTYEKLGENERALNYYRKGLRACKEMTSLFTS